MDDVFAWWVVFVHRCGDADASLEFLCGDPHSMDAFERCRLGKDPPFRGVVDGTGWAVDHALGFVRDRPSRIFCGDRVDLGRLSSTCGLFVSTLSKRRTSPQPRRLTFDLATRSGARKRFGGCCEGGEKDLQDFFCCEGGCDRSGLDLGLECGEDGTQGGEMMECVEQLIFDHPPHPAQLLLGAFLRHLTCGFERLAVLL